jgi:hypothetical protein
MPAMMRSIGSWTFGAIDAEVAQDGRIAGPDAR